jgi:hypothetical protein
MHLLVIPKHKPKSYSAKRDYSIASKEWSGINQYKENA